MRESPRYETAERLGLAPRSGFVQPFGQADPLRAAPSAGGLPQTLEGNSIMHSHWRYRRSLKARASFITMLLTVSCSIWGNGQPRQGSPDPAASTSHAQERAPQSEKTTTNAGRGSDTSPTSIKLLHSGKSAEEVQQEIDAEHGKAAREEWLVALTGIGAAATAILAVITGLLAKYTYKLWNATVQLGQDAKDAAQRQAGEMAQSLAISKQAADAAKASADAAVKSSMPVLFPFITEMSQLHPLDPISSPTTHDANIFLAFDNYGKTPGAIRRVHAQLFLTTRDELPDVDVGSLPIHPYAVMVPGNARGKDLITGALDLKQPVDLNPAELNQLLSEATGNFRRFALLGKVVYDDLFGSRHTSSFCIKLRLWSVGGALAVKRTFQVAHGGSRYNSVTSERVPTPDPLG